MGEVPKQLKKYVFKVGNKGGGRPKGSLKDFVRQHFAKMKTEEKLKFMNSLDPDIVWRMGEGNPATKIDAEIDVKIEKLGEIQKATQSILNEQDKGISKEPV